MQDWKQLTVAQLREQYEQERYVPNQGEVLGGMARRSREVREAITVDAFRYGIEADETGWWCPPAGQGGEIVCLIHGGAWRGGRGENYLYPAPWITAGGRHYVSLEFGSALDFQGRIQPMVDQVRRGLSHVIRQAEARGASPRVHLVGHSSGAHLAACLATLDWRVLVPEYPDALRSMLLCSGSYDLEPVSHSGRREYLRLDAAEIQTLSPLRQVFDPRRPIFLTVGEHESPEFRRHYETLRHKLSQAGVPLREWVAPGLNHFEIIQTFDADGALGRFWQESLARM